MTGRTETPDPEAGAAHAILAPTLHGRIALITGGSRGIGRAIGLKLARHGADIVVNYLRHRAAAEETAAELRAFGVRATTVRADVGEPDGVRHLFAAVRSAFGALDILVSNAALGVLRPAMELEPKHWQRTLDVMGRALLLCAQEAVPLMEGRAGTIVSISSLGSTRVIPHYAGPGAAKATLETLTRYLAVELAPRNVSVNAVSGGIVETEALKPFPNRAELVGRAEGSTPWGRVGRPEDIANVVYLLCQPEARWICGQTIIADGGYSLVG
ncbi:MAG: SDR family oxidoreductase [Chloroflexi bacterium]|nr:SDR family oxidoreductase [Chloroflexota bacterium]